MEKQPNYYSVMTADVRYDKRLSDFEKILFSEISALSNKNGYCTAHNKYFSDLYGKHEKSIQRNITNLKKYGFVEIEKIYENEQIKERRIYITPSNNSVSPRNKNVTTPSNVDVTTPSNTNVTDNITSINNTSINKDIVGLAPDNTSEPHEELVEKPDKIPYKQIIDYLNGILGTKYRASSTKTRSLIKARWSEGFTFDDFKKVIANKNSEWGNDPQMAKYLRPETLFGTKFEAYLNQRGVAPNKDRPNQLGW